LGLPNSPFGLFTLKIFFQENLKALTFFGTKFYFGWAKRVGKFPSVGFFQFGDFGLKKTSGLYFTLFFPQAKVLGKKFFNQGSGTQGHHLVLSTIKVFGIYLGNPIFCRIFGGNSPSWAVFPKGRGAVIF